MKKKAPAAMTFPVWKCSPFLCPLIFFLKRKLKVKEITLTFKDVYWNRKKTYLNRKNGVKDL